MSSDEIASWLEARGWLRSVAGDADFDETVRAISIALDEGLGIIVSGLYGVGKTSLMKAIVPPYAFTVNLALTTDPLTREWQELYAVDPAEMNVFLDDLGAEPHLNNFGIKMAEASDFVIRWHARHEQGRRLFVTTNLTVDELDDRYGGRLLSRLKDLCVPLRLNGKDKRKWTLR